MAFKMNNALPGPSGQGAKSMPFLTSTWANHRRLGATLKGAIVWLAVRSLMPARLATRLINSIGLREV